MLAPLFATIVAITTTVRTTPPISIESCTFVRSASFTRGVRVVYKNTSKLPVTLVIFSIRQRSRETAVMDQGAFDPGQTVDHVLTSAPLTLWMGERAERCAVVHVHFANGTSWGR